MLKTLALLPFFFTPKTSFAKVTPDTVKAPKLCLLTADLQSEATVKLLSWIRQPDQKKASSTPSLSDGSLMIQSFRAFKPDGSLQSEGLEKTLALLPQDCRILHFHWNPSIDASNRPLLKPLKKALYRQNLRDAFLVAPAGQKRMGQKKKTETIGGSSLLGSIQGFFFVAMALRNGQIHPGERHGSALTLALYHPDLSEAPLNEAAARFSGLLLQELIKDPSLTPKALRRRGLKTKGRARLSDFFEGHQ